MPLHLINETPVFIHELQNVLLISAAVEKPIDQKAVQDIVANVVLDRDDALVSGRESEYHIQDPGVPFDVFVRQGDTLMQYSFNVDGTFVPDPDLSDPGFRPRDLDADGLFHFQFTVPEKPMEAFRVNDEDFRITRVTAEAFTALSVAEQDTMLDEISAFNKTHFPEHFKLWDLDSDRNPGGVREHFRHLQFSLSSLYVIRDSKGEMVAINGISATADNQLTYQSMTVTRTADRGKGFMAIDLARATADYPNAVMSAYFVNPGIRRALGNEAMTHANHPNRLPKRCDYLEKVIAERIVGLDVPRAAAACSTTSMKHQLHGIKDLHDVACEDDSHEVRPRTPTS